MTIFFSSCPWQIKNNNVQELPFSHKLSIHVALVFTVNLTLFTVFSDWFDSCEMFVWDSQFKNRLVLANECQHNLAIYNWEAFKGKFVLHLFIIGILGYFWDALSLRTDWFLPTNVSTMAIYNWEAFKGCSKKRNVTTNLVWLGSWIWEAFKGCFLIVDLIINWKYRKNCKWCHLSLFSKMSY